MGEAITRELVLRGWFVGMADIRENPSLTKEFGNSAKFYQCNVASYESQATVFSDVFTSRGQLDALCANAGIGDQGSVYILNHRDKDEIPPAPDLTCTDVNWKGVLYGTQLAVHFMRRNPTPGGVVVATGSIVAMHPHASYAEYNGTKAAVLNFVRGSAGVLKKKDNVRLNCKSSNVPSALHRTLTLSMSGVMPGIVDTAIVPREMIAAVNPSEYVAMLLPNWFAGCMVLTSVASRPSRTSCPRTCVSSRMKR